MNQPCGCIVEQWRPGVKRSVSRCEKHRREGRAPEVLDAAYYRHLGILDEHGEQVATRHVAELVEALGDIPAGSGELLEIGCGVSPYVDYSLSRGYHYRGLDAAPFAVNFLKRHPSGMVNAQTCTWPYDWTGASVVLSAHALEHMTDVLASLRAMHAALVAGGLLVLLVPDESDLMNPDHLWFFTPEGIESLVVEAGFRIVRQAVRQVVPRERFIYIQAEKPGGAVARADMLPTSYPGLEGESLLTANELDFITRNVDSRGYMLEIGSASGVTAARIAELRPELRVVSLDPYHEYPARLLQWRKNAKPNQNLWVGSVQELSVFCTVPFDAILVDGDHHHVGVYGDLLHAERLLRPGGALFCHDYDTAGLRDVTLAVDKFIARSGYLIVGRVGSVVMMRRTA